MTADRQRRRPPTIGDVAERAGVSKATVSRVLNRQPIGRAGQGRPGAGCRRPSSGYEPFGPAQALRQQRVRVWAVIIADIENPFFTSMVRGIEDVAHTDGYRLVLCNSDGDVDKEAGYLDIAIRERMAGVVIAAASTTESAHRAAVGRRHPGRRRRPPARRPEHDRLGGGRQPSPARPRRPST